MLVMFSLVHQLPAKDQPAALQTVPRVELEKYVGNWYEIARYPNRFQRHCVADTTATYELRSDGRVTVINRCREKSESGPFKEARGVAWVVDKLSGAKLKVRFFWPFSGDYWVIDLGPNYEYAVVGHPDRSYLWILSRTPRIDRSLYEEILQRLKSQGYDPSRLLLTRHAETASAKPAS